MMKANNLPRPVMALVSGLNRAITSCRARGAVRPAGEPAKSRLSFGDEGQQLLEAAFTLPVLLMMLTGIFGFGIAFNNKIILTEAVGAGANYLQTIRTTTTNPCADTFTAVKQAAPGLNPGSIVLTVTMNGDTPSQTGNSCPGAQTDMAQGAPVTVSATYPCTLGVYGVKFTSSCLLYAQETVYEY